MKNFVGLFAFVCLLSVSAQAEMKAPGKAVQAAIDKIKVVVANESELPKEKLDGELEQIVRNIFNFNEMSRRCLGKNWKNANPQQRKEFTNLFTQLLSKTYLNRLKKINESEIKFDNEKVKGKRAVVNTTIKHNNGNFKMNYRMGNKKGSWEVYDVVIENISLVSNYRSEFDAIIRKDQIDGLISRLKEKVNSEADAEPIGA